MTELTPYGRNTDLFQHPRESRAPRVNGRDIKYVDTCKICNLVSNLTNKQDYEWDDAVQVEADVYRMIYSMWSASEIARWLNDAHEYDVSHDSVNRHINKHIPDPVVAFYERIRAYGAGHTQKRFVKEMAETMRLTATQFRQDVLAGATEVKPSDFVKIFETLKEWDEISESSEQKVLTAVMNTMNEVITDENLKAKFDYHLRTELERIDDQYED